MTLYGTANPSSTVIGIGEAQKDFVAMPAEPIIDSTPSESPRAKDE